jgi:hypothetical protein
MSGTPEGLTGDPVQTLEVTNPLQVQAAMCEDCACPKASSTTEGRPETGVRGEPELRVTGGAAVVAAARAGGEQITVTFALTGSASQL